MARPKGEETIAVGMRLPIELIDRVDAYARRLDAERPGTKHNRTDAVRIALLSFFAGLPEDEGGETEPASASPKGKATAKRGGAKR